uniref:Uncharacterized protein n=1 Tax=Oryza glumipatula TaxID=40148 RepID=A0A0D9YNV2_9ORYZ
MWGPRGSRADSRLPHLAGHRSIAAVPARHREISLPRHSLGDTQRAAGTRNRTNSLCQRERIDESSDATQEIGFHACSAIAIPFLATLIPRLLRPSTATNPNQEGHRQEEDK